MAGNVWEWTQDWYHGSYDGAPPDGSAWKSITAAFRVFRGGSWLYSASGARAAFRNFDAPGFRIRSLGLRSVRERRD